MPPPPSGPAQLFVSTTGSDSGSCTAAAPCRSFDRAYRVAKPGQIVEVAGGSYGSQSIGYDASKTSADDVVFRPAAGATVTVGELAPGGAKHVTFVDMDAEDLFVVPQNGSSGGQRPEDVTFWNVDAQFFFVRAGKDVTIAGGSIGGIDTAISSTIGTYPGLPVSENVLVDGVGFHDVTRTANPSGHVECLFVQESNGTTIRRSRFTRCDVMDVFVNEILGGSITNLTIENNWFDRPTGGGAYALYLYPRGANGAIRYNSFRGGVIFDGSFSGLGWTATGNAGWASTCGTGVVHTRNVWENRTCGSTDLQAVPGFVDASGFDLHLAPGAAALGRGSATDHPAVDIDGEPRPRNGSTPDAGADEA
ncbi:MAG: hypothetical protein R3C15_00785 [Thermoleophilia bacterium]